MKILVVEDELSLQKSLAKGLRKYGYAVDTASGGEDALMMLGDSFYSAVILDLNLPKIDGIEVLKEIRKSDKEIKILILSARCALESKIEGLDQGANDFLAKPFHFAELEARLRALLRRQFIQQDAITEVCGICVNTSEKSVTVSGERIALTKKEYGILEYLILNLGKAITAEELIGHIWEEDADLFANSFKVCLNNLKKKLHEKTQSGDIIKNLRGIGYYIAKE